MARVQADRTRPAVVKAPNTDNSLYYRGEKDKHRDGLREQLVKLVNDNDFEGRILAHKTLCTRARGFGPEGWPESDRELRLAREVPGSKSLASIAQIAAAEGSLLFEKGDLESAAFHLKAALSHLKRCKDLDSLRQFVSSSWKAAEIAHALGDTSGAKGHIDRALRVSEEIGDLHKIELSSARHFLA